MKSRYIFNGWAEHFIFWPHRGMKVPQLRNKVPVWKRLLIDNNRYSPNYGRYNHYFHHTPSGAEVRGEMGQGIAAEGDGVDTNILDNRGREEPTNSLS